MPPRTPGGWTDKILMPVWMTLQQGELCDYECMNLVMVILWHVRSKFYMPHVLCFPVFLYHVLIWWGCHQTSCISERCSPRHGGWWFNIGLDWAKSQLNMLAVQPNCCHAKACMSKLRSPCLSQQQTSPQALQGLFAMIILLAALSCCSVDPCQHKQAIVIVVQQAMVTMLLQLATLFFICYCFSFMYWLLVAHFTQTHFRLLSRSK